MSHLRRDLQRRGICAAADLKNVANGNWVKTAGVVIVRQRPGTAKGFLFITLEDETGMSNVIVVPDVFQKHRTLLQSAGILQVEGPLQCQDGVIHVRGRRFQRLDVDRGALPASHDFR
jgi:error-prone DNA polymerase